MELDSERVRATVLTGAIGGFFVGQAAAQAMLPRGPGSIFFTGATASIKGMNGSAPFAMQKFALRGLAQSMAGEFQPSGLHVAHFVIDGIIASRTAERDVSGATDRRLDPNVIAQTYLEVHRQHRSAWATELDLRPWVEVFGASQLRDTERLSVLARLRRFDSLQCLVNVNGCDNTSSMFRGRKPIGPCLTT